MLIERGCKWKKPDITRLQKGDDSVHQPVVVWSFRFDLRHSSPHVPIDDWVPSYCAHSIVRGALDTGVS